MRILGLRSVFVLALLSATQAMAWGGKGHMSVNRVALTMVANPEAKKFLDANSEQIIRFATIPDIKWKSGTSVDAEKPMHWFEMDGYESNRFGSGLPDLAFGKAQSDLGKDYVTKYGLAMWRVSDFYQQLVQALGKGNYKLAIQIAGVMGHYVGDMTQPMHSSMDYDGQSINKPGVHKYYETTLVDQMDGQHLFDDLQKSAGLRRSYLEKTVGNNLDVAKLQHLSWSEATDAYSGLGDVLKHFDQANPDDKWLESDLMPRIARASALLGKIWDVAFTVAQSQNLPVKNVGAQDPEWMPMGQ